MGLAMRHVVIENPVINSPFTEPARHFRFTDEGITNETVDAAKVVTAKTRWIPAVKNDESFGRWDFMEINDPWHAVATISASSINEAVH